MPKHNKSTETEVTPEIIEGYTKVLSEIKNLKESIGELRDEFRHKQRIIEEIKRDIVLCDEKYRAREMHLLEYRRHVLKKEESITLDNGQYHKAIEQKATQMSGVKEEIERLQGAIFTRTCLGVFVILILIWYSIAKRRYHLPSYYPQS